MNFLDRRSIVRFLITEFQKSFALLLCKSMFYHLQDFAGSTRSVTLVRATESCDSLPTLLSKSRPTYISKCDTHRQLSWCPFPLESPLKIHFYLMLSTLQMTDVPTGYDLPLQQSSGGFRFLGVLFLLRRELSRPGHVAKFIIWSHQEQIKRRIAMLWLEISIRVLLKNVLPVPWRVTGTGCASVLQLLNEVDNNLSPLICLLYLRC